MNTPEKGTEEQAQLLQQAQNEFTRKNYENCWTLLNSVQSYDGQPERLAHNKVVAEFYKNNLRSVNSTLKKLEELVQDTNKYSRPVAYLHYNYALVLYQKRQFNKALSVLKPLQRLLCSGDQQADEVLSGHVALLTLATLCETDHRHASTTLAETQGAKMRFMSMETTLFEEGGAQWDFKDMWQLVVNRVAVLCRSTEVKLGMKPESAEYCVLRAHQHFLKHDIQMAAKELSKKFPRTSTGNGENRDTVLANNMGLIHFSVRHYAMAVRFFQYALNFESTASANCLNDAALIELSACRRPDIMYNLGISMLHLERPQEAFDCLLVPLNYHHNNPRLWLRLAEACIMMHRKNERYHTTSHLLTCGAIGSGMLRKFILRPWERKYKSELSDNYAIPNPNLEFATLCLSNALLLVKNIQASTKDLDRPVSSAPSSPMTRMLVEKVRCTILSNLSYSYLHLGEFTLALKYGMELLDQKDPTFRFLANMYCAEAVVMMDRAHRVFPFINPTLFKEFNSTQDNSMELTQAIFYYNSSVSLVMNNDLGKARLLLAKCNHVDIRDQVMKLRVYLDLCFGNAELPNNLALIEDKCLQ